MAKLPQAPISNKRQRRQGFVAQGDPYLGKNRLLALLSPRDFALLQPHLSPIRLRYKDSLYEADEAINDVYFIESGVGSLVSSTRGGRTAEVGTIGNEGFVGLPVLFEDRQAPSAVYMQVAGTGLQIKAKAFLGALQQSSSIRTTMLHYAHAFFNLVTQTAACAHFHSLEQRCARWLLMTRDRMGSDEFTLTQEFLAMMLGVRRGGVTIAAGALKKAALISYRSGLITIHDPVGLQKRSCECYKVTKREFDRLLGPEWTAFHHPPKT